MAKHPSANDRRANARAQARQIAAAQAKKEKTVKTVLYTGIAVVVVAVIAVVGTLVWQSSRPVTPPQNMVSGTVAFAAGDDGLQAVQPQGEEEDADVSALPTAAEAGADDGAAVVKVYLDFQCPGCKAFEDTNGDTLTRLAEEGSIIFEYEPVAILDRMSGGNEYSTRSSNMISCIADSGQTDLIPDVSLALFAQQPGEGETGMEDDQLLSIAESAGVDLDAAVNVEDSATVRDCVTNVGFDRYVESSTQDALNDEGLEGTPHITIDGEPYTGEWSDREAFAADLIRASSQG
ncbi:DsbA family protein [Brevibacterium yomogidense]|uniref:DsbA family protein n=1 Tax=Brevibacterium yomogidense TaxID=946573 RepID=UPI0018E01336|nr:thioredoxin domain-containing protein [Brevibacterium yomogidense]